jgi:hypothetical protein
MELKGEAVWRAKLVRGRSRIAGRRSVVRRDWSDFTRGAFWGRLGKEQQCIDDLSCSLRLRVLFEDISNSNPLE